MRQLTRFSRYKRSTLNEIINRWLKCSPPAKELYNHANNLIFDGTYLHQRVSIVVLMNAANHNVIAGQYRLSENSQPQMQAFFEFLKSKKLSPSSCTVDGNPHVIRVLKKTWPNIIIQRCLVHIQRQGLMWCRQKPKRTDAKILRKIFLQIPYIKTYQQRDIFLAQVHAWELHYGHIISLTPERGWVFSDLKRARSMLLKAIPNMFHFLNDPNIPSTTNGLEGYFARLKQHYRHHRGMTPSKRHNYFQWYFHFRPH